MAIVTLTRQAGSFGDEIGMLIARRLGYTFYDKHEIERRIIAKGLPKEEFLKYDERKPNFLARFAKNRDKYLNYLSSVVLEIAKEGKLTKNEEKQRIKDEKRRAKLEAKAAKAAKDLEEFNNGVS